MWKMKNGIAGSGCIVVNVLALLLCNFDSNYSRWGKHNGQFSIRLVYTWWHSITWSVCLKRKAAAHGGSLVSCWWNLLSLSEHLQPVMTGGQVEDRHRSGVDHRSPSSVSKQAYIRLRQIYFVKVKRKEESCFKETLCIKKNFDKSSIF